MKFDSLEVLPCEKSQIFNKLYGYGSADFLKYYNLCEAALLFLKAEVIKHSRKNSIDGHIYDMIKNDFVNLLSQTKYGTSDIESDYQYPELVLHCHGVYIIDINKSFIRDERIQPLSMSDKHKGMKLCLNNYIEQLTNPVNNTLTPICDFIYCDFFDYVNAESNKLLLNDLINKFNSEDAKAICSLYWLMYIANQGLFKNEISKIFNLIKQKPYDFEGKKIVKICHMHINCISFDFNTGSRVTITFKNHRVVSIER